MLLYIRSKVIAAIVASLFVVTAQLPPFPFGFSAGDIFTDPNDDGTSSRVPLPQPMRLFNNDIVAIRQGTDGFIHFFLNNTNIGASVAAYFMDLDTRNGGLGQNELWVRAGNRSAELTLARDIIAGNGTIFNPQAIVVATWFKVEAFNQTAGPQNTFQLAIAYSATRAVFAIFSYTQLEYFSATNNRPGADVFVTDSNIAKKTRILFVDSTEIMIRLLFDTNCNRRGVYVFRMQAGFPTQAPTPAPTKAPTKAPISSAPLPAPTECGLFGMSVICPLSLCGVFGRSLGFCETAE